MAGSRRDFSYDSDSGTRYAVNIDESNGKGVLSAPDGSGPLNLYNTAVAPFPGRAPQSFKKRYLNTYNRANPVEKRVFSVGNVAAYNYAANNASIVTAFRVGADSTPVAVEWVVKSARPEQRGTVPDFSTDSGLNDGTPAGNA